MLLHVALTVSASQKQGFVADVCTGSGCPDASLLTSSTWFYDCEYPNVRIHGQTLAIVNTCTCICTIHRLGYTCTVVRLSARVLK